MMPNKHSKVKTSIMRKIKAERTIRAIMIKRYGYKLPNKIVCLELEIPRYHYYYKCPISYPNRLYL